MVNGPTQNIDRLETALRNADAAGDTQAAQQIAQQIRQLQAAPQDEGQPVSPDTGVTTPGAAATVPTTDGRDRFANVPVEIGGIPLTDDIKEMVLRGRELEDPKQRRIIAARIAGRLDAQQGGNQFLAGLRSFGAGVFGLGDIAAAGGQFVANQVFEGGDISFGDALEIQREYRRALEEKFPVTATVGEVAGALAGGGLVASGLRRGAAKLGTGAGQRLTNLTTLQKGQRVANVAKVAAGGAAGGAITEGITEGEATEGALLGAAGGAFGLGLVRAGQVSVKTVREMLDDPRAKGLRVLAKQLGESAEEIGMRFQQFQEVLGRPPSTAEIANPQAVAELRRLISEAQGGAAVAREQAETIGRRRAAEFGEDVAGGRVVTTPARQRQTRDVIAREAFQDVEDVPITFSAEQVDDLILDRTLRDALPRTLRRRLDDALNEVAEGQPLTLTGLDVNDLRLALRDRARGATGADRVFGELADEVEDIARSQSDEFGRAIDEFARRSRRAEGVTAGQRVAGARTGEFVEEARQAVDPDIAAGLRVGARAGLSDKARESIGQSVTLARKLSENSGLVQRLRAVMPAREVDRLQEVGRIQSRALENIETVAPSVIAQADKGIRQAVNDTVSAAVAAQGGTGGAFRVAVTERILRRLTPRLSDKVSQNLARDLFNPNRTTNVLAALRRAEVPEEEILDLFAGSIAAGSQAAQTGEN